MIGLPRKADCSCCSQEAKKALRSRNSHCTALAAGFSFIICSTSQPQLFCNGVSPPRAAIRLYSPRFFLTSGAPRAL
jgi:hypothetical protein